MIKQNQILQQTQKLTPQQVQLIRMLELPVIELEDRIRKELEENPTLEEGKEVDNKEGDSDLSDDYDNNDASDSHDYEIDLGDYRNEDEIPDYRLQESARQKEYKQPEMTYSGSSSFADFLLDQLSLKDLNKDVIKCAQ